MTPRLLPSLILAAAASLLSAPAHSLADYAVDPAAFNQNNLISDADFTNSDSMTGDSLNAFLASKGSWLANYTIPQTVTVPYFCKVNGSVVTQTVAVNQVKPDGSPLYGMRAADLLVTTSQKSQVNPQVLLSLLERESSGVTSGNPSSDFTRAWPLFYGFDETLASGNYPCDQALKKAGAYGGLGQQIAYTPLGLHNRYVDANMNPIIDGVQITAASHGTAALYAYTPHIRSGNYNFWFNFTKWFSSPPPPSYRPNLFTKNGDVYFADSGKIWHILSGQAFDSFGFNSNDIVDASRSKFANYPKGGDIGTLVSAGSGRVYLIQGGKKRPIASAAIFSYFGFDWNAIRPLDDAVLNNIPMGIPLYELVRASGGSRVYIQSHGQNYHVTNPDIFANAWGFDWNEIVDMPTYEINQFPVAADLNRLALDNSGRIYFMDSGKRYWIPDPTIFSGFGFDSGNVIWLEDYFLNRLPYAGALNYLVGSPKGDIYFVYAGKKHHISAANWVIHNLTLDNVSFLSQSGIDSIATGGEAYQ